MPALQPPPSDRGALRRSWTPGLFVLAMALAPVVLVLGALSAYAAYPAGMDGPEPADHATAAVSAVLASALTAVPPLIAALRTRRREWFLVTAGAFGVPLLVLALWGVAVGVLAA